MKIRAITKSKSLRYYHVEVWELSSCKDKMYWQWFTVYSAMIKPESIDEEINDAIKSEGYIYLDRDIRYSKGMTKLDYREDDLK